MLSLKSVGKNPSLPLLASGVCWQSSSCLRSWMHQPSLCPHRHIIFPSYVIDSPLRCTPVILDRHWMSRTSSWVRLPRSFFPVRSHSQVWKAEISTYILGEDRVQPIIDRKSKTIWNSFIWREEPEETPWIPGVPWSLCFPKSNGEIFLDSMNYTFIFLP